MRSFKIVAQAAVFSRVGGITLWAPPPDFGQEEVSAGGDFLEVDVGRHEVGDGPNIFLSNKFI